MTIQLTSIGTVRSPRDEPVDDNWETVESHIELTESFSEDALAGLDTFSHAEIIFVFDRVDPATVVSGLRHPRGNTDWPKVGIFAQRGKNRPNRIGLTTCEIVNVEGRTLVVRGLDAIDGTPVLDIKPVMTEFLPRGDVLQPEWSHELMKNYWNAES